MFSNLSSWKEQDATLFQNGEKSAKLPLEKLRPHYAGNGGFKSNEVISTTMMPSLYHIDPDLEKSNLSLLKIFRQNSVENLTKTEKDVL